MGFEAGEFAGLELQAQAGLWRDAVGVGGKRACVET